jgi:hypothetical protein
MEEFLLEGQGEDFYKDLEDGVLILRFLIPGRPSTKKTSQRVVRRGGFTRILPSLLYEKYEKHCEVYCKDLWCNKNLLPMDFGVGIKLKVYLDSWVVGDECGYQQAHGDIIQKHGIIANDMWIHWLDRDSHMIYYDKENPRIEVEIYRYRHPKEEYNLKKKKKSP